MFSVYFNHNKKNQLEKFLTLPLSSLLCHTSVRQLVNKGGLPHKEIISTGLIPG